MPRSKTMCHSGTTTFVSAKDTTRLWYAAMLKTSPGLHVQPEWQQLLSRITRYTEARDDSHDEQRAPQVSEERLSPVH